MMTFAIAALAIGLIGAQGPILQDDGRVPFPLQNDGVPLFAPAAFDALTIGEPLGRGDRVTRRALGELQDQTFELERLRVVSSVCFAPRSTITVLVPWWKIAPQALPIGRRVLLIATKRRDGFLNWPRAGEARVDYTQYPSASSTEALGLAFFCTNATVLPPDGRPQWRLLTSLAQCIAGTSTDNVKAIAHFMSCEPPPGVTGLDLTAGKEPDEYCSLFEQAVSGEPAYHKALVYEALNRFYYYGTSDLYLQALVDCANDPNAFPNGVGRPMWAEQIGFDPPRTTRHHVFDVEGTTQLIAQSRNSRVAAYLLKQLDRAPINESELVPKLDDPDPELRWTLVDMMSKWHHAPDHAPQRPVNDPPAYVRRYPGLADCVSYWRDYLRSH